MKRSTLATLASLAGYSIFGFSFLFSKLALDMTSPFVLLSVRFLTAFLVLNLLLLTKRVSISLKNKPVLPLLLMGLVQPVIYFICEAYGIAMTSSSFSGVMIGLVPVAGLIFGVLFLKEKCTLFQVACTLEVMDEYYEYLGEFLGTLCSVVGVTLTTSGGMGTFSLPGFLLLLGAVTSGALFTVLSRSIAGHFSAFERTYVMFALGSAVFTAIAAVESRGNVAALAAPLPSPAFWGAVLYLAVVSSVCAFLLINFSLNHISAGRSLIFSNFTTVISVLAGIFLMGDAFSPIQLLGIAIITASVFGVSYQKEA